MSSKDRTLGGGLHRTSSEYITYPRDMHTYIEGIFHRSVAELVVSGWCGCPRWHSHRGEPRAGVPDIRDRLPKSQCRHGAPFAFGLPLTPFSARHVVVTK